MTDLENNHAMFSRKIIGRMFNFDKIANNHLLILDIAKTVMNEYRKSKIINLFRYNSKGNTIKNNWNDIKNYRISCS